ncbi:MAG TPA: hypothetical protein VFY84_07335 [Jiangellales bacterium]|nr:hypothetical protein [Jiangellales bacterium]
MARDSTRLGAVHYLGGPLTGDDDFTRVQDLLSNRARRGNAVHKPHRSRHPYLFKSLIYCAIRDRRMQGQHSHGDAYYRCRFPQEYALANRLEHPRNVYMREEALVDPLDRWLLQAFAPAQRDRMDRRNPGRTQASARPAPHPIERA